MIDVVNRTLPQEHTNRWREFWETKTVALARVGLHADVGVTVALIYRGNAVLAAFDLTHTPDQINARIAALIAPVLVVNRG